MPLRNKLQAIQKIITPHYGKGMQKLHRNGEFPYYVLTRVAKIAKTNI